MAGPVPMLSYQTRPPGTSMYPSRRAPPSFCLHRPRPLLRFSMRPSSPNLDPGNRCTMQASRMTGTVAHTHFPGAPFVAAGALLAASQALPERTCGHAIGRPATGIRQSPGPAPSLWLQPPNYGGAGGLAARFRRNVHDPCRGVDRGAAGDGRLDRAHDLPRRPRRSADRPVPRRPFHPRAELLGDPAGGERDSRHPPRLRQRPSARRRGGAGAAPD